MNPLFIYYAFLVASAVLMYSLRDSSLVARRRSANLSFLMAPAFLLIVLSLQASPSILVFIAAVVVLVTIEQLVGRWARDEHSRSSLRLWICLWLVEAALPLMVHFIFRSQPGIERWLLMVTGLFISVTVFLIYMIWAPDLRKKTLNQTG